MIRLTLYPLLLRIREFPQTGHIAVIVCCLDYIKLLYCENYQFVTRIQERKSYYV